MAATGELANIRPLFHCIFAYVTDLCEYGKGRKKPDAQEHLQSSLYMSPVTFGFVLLVIVKKHCIRSVEMLQLFLCVKLFLLYKVRCNALIHWWTHTPTLFYPLLYIKN